MVRVAIRTAALSLALVAVCALPARADYEAGQAAWDAGQYPEALAEWLAAADEGDRRAMLALGRLYLQGLGAPQNYVEAHMWFNLAGSRGELDALTERDALAERMTPEERAEAQRRASAWLPRAGEVAAAPVAPVAPAAAAAPVAPIAPVAPAAAPVADAGALAAPDAEPPPDAGPPPPRSIQEAQALLTALGYAPGPADGVWGPRTGAAYAAFLRDAGLPVEEMLTAEGLSTLREAAGEDPALLAVLEDNWPVGKEFRDCFVCPEMVVVPPGAFIMGSPPSEEDRDDDEGPTRRVTIPVLFAVGKYEVTFAEWDACLAAGGCGGYRPDDRGWGGDRHPVIHARSQDARAYVDWLSRETGALYRLLSESEWEYAARAGTTGPFHFGATISTDLANYNGYRTYGEGPEGVSRERTVPVGSFPANGFGLYDMHGNVSEWVEDCWHESYDGAPADGGAWTAGGDCSRHVRRGGSWISGPGNLRAANRSRIETEVSLSSSGFRIARTLTP